MDDLGPTGDEILTGLVMGRQTALNLAIVVEGIEDYALVNPHVDPNAPLLVEVAGGKEACLEAARLAERDGHDWLRTLVDRDFDRELGTAGGGLRPS